jgi:hypothetical protein
VRPARLSTIGLVALFCLQAAAGAVYAYYTLFATFRSWDDEGTFMLWDHYLLRGAALYDDVWNIYGPLPYVLRWVLHVAGVPLTHDATRFLTLVLWLATAALLSLAVYRMSRSIAAAALVHLLVLRYLNWIANEPGHSQEYLLVLLAGVVYASTFVGRAPRATLAVLGAAVAAAVFIKVNAGVYLALALAAATLAVAAPHALLGGVRVLAGLGLVAAPILLLGAVPVGAPTAGATPWSAFVLAYTVAAALVLAASRRLRPGDAVSPAAIGAAIISGLATTAVVVGLTMALLGSSLGAQLEGVFLLPSRQFTWSAAASSGEPLGDAWLAAASLGAFVLAAVLGRTRGGVHAVVQTVFGVLLCLLLAALPPGRPTYLVVLWAVLPFLWMTLPAPGRAESVAMLFPRLVLTLTAVAQALYVYPVTGTQVMLATFLFVPCGVVALHDGSAALLGWLAPASAGRLRLAGASLLAAALVAGYGLMDRQAQASYRHGKPLGLPGASRLRLEEEPRIAIFRWLVHNTARQCDTFLALPTFNSLYFWAGVEPPGPLSRSLVLDLFDVDHQRAMLDALAPFPRRCVILSTGELGFWFDGRAEKTLDLPLVQHVQKAFGPLGDLWGSLLLVPAGRTHPPLTYAGCTRTAADGATMITLAVPALSGGPIDRFVLTDLRTTVVLADSAIPRTGATLRLEGGGRLELGAPRHVVLRSDVAIPGDGFVVVQLYDASGTWRESVPVIGTCETQPVEGA